MWQGSQCKWWLNLRSDNLLCALCQGTRAGLKASNLWWPIPGIECTGPWNIPMMWACVLHRFVCVTAIVFLEMLMLLFSDMFFLQTDFVCLEACVWFPKQSQLFYRFVHRHSYMLTHTLRQPNPSEAWNASWHRTACSHRQGFSVVLTHEHFKFKSFRCTWRAHRWKKRPGSWTIHNML